MKKYNAKTLKAYLLSTGLAAMITLTGCANPNKSKGLDYAPSIGLHPLGPNKSANEALAEKRLYRAKLEAENQIEHNQRNGSPKYSGIEITLFSVRLF